MLLNRQVSGHLRLSQLRASYVRSADYSSCEKRTTQKIIHKKSELVSTPWTSCLPSRNHVLWGATASLETKLLTKLGANAKATRNWIQSYSLIQQFYRYLSPRIVALRLIYVLFWVSQGGLLFRSPWEGGAYCLGHASSLQFIAHLRIFPNEHATFACACGVCVVLRCLFFS